MQKKRFFSEQVSLAIGFFSHWPGHQTNKLNTSLVSNQRAVGFTIRPATNLIAFSWDFDYRNCLK